MSESHEPVNQQWEHLKRQASGDQHILDCHERKSTGFEQSVVRITRFYVLDHQNLLQVLGCFGPQTMYLQWQIPYSALRMHTPAFMIRRTLASESLNKPGSLRGSPLVTSRSA